MLRISNNHKSSSINDKEYETNLINQKIITDPTDTYEFEMTFLEYKGVVSFSLLRDDNTCNDDYSIKYISFILTFENNQEHKLRVRLTLIEK